MNTIINYAYLAGRLESELKALAYDTKFLSIDKNDFAARADYLIKLIEMSKQAANEYSKNYEAA